jgi:hypothetical protein
MKYLPSLVLLFLYGYVRSLKIAVMSDIHIQPYYDPDISNLYACNPLDPDHPFDWIRKHMLNDSHAPLGRLFCDPPAVLTESFMKKIALEEKPDVLIVAGDIIGHKLTQNIS